MQKIITNYQINSIQIQNIDKWILSRINHNNGKLLQLHLKYHKCNQEELISIWKKLFLQHVNDVKTYFKNRSNDLLIFDIEKDKIDTIVEFLKDFYILDKHHYIIRGITDKK